MSNYWGWRPITPTRKRRIEAYGAMVNIAWKETEAIKQAVADETSRQRRLEASEHFRAIPYAEVTERLMAR